MTGISAGSARIDASSSGRVGSAHIAVRAARASVHTVVFSPAGEVQLEPEAQLQLAARVRAANDSVLTDRAVAWATMQPAVAIVNDAGVLAAIAAGTAKIVVSSEGRADISL